MKKVSRRCINVVLIIALLMSFLPPATQAAPLPMPMFQEIEQPDMQQMPGKSNTNQEKTDILPKYVQDQLGEAERIREEAEKMRDELERKCNEEIERRHKENEQYIKQIDEQLEKLRINNEFKRVVKEKEKLQKNVIMTHEDIIIAAYEGEGTAEAPFLIRNAEQLNAIRGGVAGYSSWDLSKHYKLMNDIDLSGYSTNMGWEPIGNFYDPLTGELDSYEPFTGSLDGNGYKISNLIISNNTVFTGLFGTTSNSTVIKNLQIDNANILGTGVYVGSLVGWNEGSLINCSVSGNLEGYVYVGGLVGINKGGKIIGIRASFVNIEGDMFVGGLVGNIASGEVIDATTVSGIVRGNSRLGGLVGENEGIVKDASVKDAEIYGTASFSYGAGGMAGINLGEITNSTVVSKIIESGYWIGGFVGENSGIIKNSTATLQSIQSSDEIYAYSYSIGGFVGENSGKITGASTKVLDVIEGNFSVGGFVGRNFGYIDQSSASVIGIEGKNTKYSYQIGGFSGWNDGELIGVATDANDVKGIYLVGGLTGQNTGVLNSSHSFVKHIEGTGPSSFLIGGLAGTNDRGAILSSIAFSESITITDSIPEIPFFYGGRVTGDYESSGVLVNNYANTNMVMRWSGAPYIPKSEPNGKDGLSLRLNNTNKMIQSFSLDEQLAPAWIDFVKQTISIPLEDGASLTNLVARFTLSPGATATVNGVPQESGVTANNFSNELTYTIRASDNTSTTWKVKTESKRSYIYKFLDTLGQAAQCAFFGDPVNVATGNFIDSYTDLYIPTRGIALEFKRSYNSRADYIGSLGRNWQHNYESSLTVDEDDSVTLVYPDGNIALFEYDNGAYIRPAGTFEQLQQQNDGSFLLTFKDQTKYRYSSDGKLLEIIDKNNNTNTLTYNGSILESVTDPTGRSLTFIYNAADKIEQINDMADRSIYFDYDQNDNLIAVTGVNGGTTSYTYDGNGLTSITNPEGNTAITNIYDDESRVIEQLDAMGNKTKYEYYPDNRYTIVTDGRGNQVGFLYDEYYRIIRTDYPNFIYEFTAYDENHNVIEQTDKNENTTHYTYDDNGNLLTTTEPEPFAYVSTYTYDALNNPVEFVDQAGNATIYTYDQQGNLLSVSKQTASGQSISTFAYNQYGQMTQATDPNGNISYFSYDQYGYNNRQVDPLGNTVISTYDILGRVLSEIDARGNLAGSNPLEYTTSYTYDHFGNILTTIDPLGNTITNTYDLNNNLISVTDKRGNITTYAYDKNNNLTTITDAYNNKTQYAYDASNNRIKVIDFNGNQTNYIYDELNRLTQIIDPYGKSESYLLDNNGNTVATSDRRGNISYYTFDVVNRLVQVTNPDSGTIAYQYDPLGNKIAETDANGNTTHYTYDQDSKLLTMTDADGNMTSYQYDLAGNATVTTNPKGATATSTYDAANRQVSVTDALGKISYTAYDSVGNAVYRTDANGITTEYRFDAINQLVSVKDALENITNYSYDENGNLIEVVDANGNVTTYEYDELNRLVAETDPLGNTLTREFDAMGNLVKKINPDGTVIKYMYDKNNRQTKVTYPDNTHVSYTYDAAGNRLTMVDTAGTTHYSYDSMNRLLSVENQGEVEYQYDFNGNITAITYPDQSQVRYTFDHRNLPVTVTDSVYTTYIDYDEIGSRIQERLPNGIAVNYSYDLNNRLTVIEHVYQSGALTSVTYTLDNVGNRLTATNELGEITSYTYDDLYQLIEVNYTNGQAKEIYTYDPAGNRLSKNDIEYRYDDANRLIQEGMTPYYYDANGNLTSVGQDIYYQYDYENRLVEYTKPEKTTKYRYDGDGNRIQQTVTDAVYQREKETNYIYDISKGIPVLLVETDGQGNYNNYIHGGRILSRDGWEGQIYYHQDGLGSTKKITDSQGNILNSYEYDAFGNVISVTESVYNPVLYAGELYDENGLLFLKARYYDPQTGRFLTKDTYLGDLNDPLTRNLYAYVSNNPVLYIDPSGHIKICSGSDLLDFGLDLAPGVSNFKSGVEFVTGYNYITGEKLSDFERILALSGIFTGGWVKKVKYLKHADDIAGGLAKSSNKINNIYDSIKKAPKYPDGFRGVQDGTRKTNINNKDILGELRDIEYGQWKKVYKDGYDANGKKISIHYFESSSGKVFDVKVKTGWSNK